MAVGQDLEATIEALVRRLDALERENKILREENALLKKWRFGRSSERIEPGQLGFFSDGDLPPEGDTTALKAVDAKKAKSKAMGHGRAAFPDHLEREVHTHELAEEERACLDCSVTMESIRIEVTERGHFVPAKLIVIRDERSVYACPHGHGIKTAELPDGVIDRGKYDASVYANIVTQKYCDHQPLNRLEGIYKRYGVQIPKQSMWDMISRVDELLAQPILAQMRRELLEEPILHSDETPVTLRVEGQKKSKPGWVWGWRNEPGDGPAKALVEFRQTRGRDGPLAFLSDWSGTLIIDGYSGFNEVCKQNGIVRGGCWAHARRKFSEAFDTGAADAVPMLQMINRLFALERAVKRRGEREGFSYEQVLVLRAKVRERKSAELLHRIIDAAKALEHKRTTLPKSKLGKAVAYLLNQQKPLSVFLGDPRVPIHNNDQERDLRHVIIGRKNWMLFASQRGGEVACRLFSLVMSCKQNGVNPEAYIADALMAVATTPSSEIASLTPWAWGDAQAAENGAV